MTIKKIWFLVVLTLISSCVGTIADKNAQSSVTLNESSQNANDSFKGLLSATAVAHDKVELVFDAASGDPSSLSYEIYVNNSSLPIKVSGSSLINSKTIDGSYIFTVTGLSLKTKYNFNMRVVNVATSNPSLSLDPNRSLSAETFSNETADFMGVSSLTLGSGDLATSSVTVKWIPATISGTSLNIKPNDPIAYELTYWRDGFAKSVVQLPSSYAVPVLNRDSYHVVNNLQPGTVYYFQVRAIQKSYALNIASDPLFKRETNSRVMKITTAATVPLDLSFITTGNLYLTNPNEVRGREELDVSWDPAWGNHGFFQYRVFYKKVNVNLQEHLQDQLSDLNNLAPGTLSVDVDSSLTSVSLLELDPKEFYQVKVYVCTTVVVPEVCSINTQYKNIQIKPPLSPFTGILATNNPISITKLDEIGIEFDSPDTNRGFLNKINVYCHNPANVAQKVLVPSNGTSTGGATGISACNNTAIAPFLTGSFPTTLEEFATFTKFSIKLKQIANGVDKFCFSMTAAVSYTDIPSAVAEDETENPVIKCITPSMLTPTVAQFPGRESNCNINGNSMTITWPQPTGGLYTGYLLFYKKKASPSDVFSFPHAISDYYGPNTNGYTIVDVPSTTYSKKVTGLIEGENYFAGVLTYIVNPLDITKKVFSSFNANTGECRFPTPSPVFTEWVDLMALGPKEDALATGFDSSAANLFEKLDANGAPIEVADAAETSATAAFDGGIARTKIVGGLTTYHKSSSTGIVKLVWKDVTFTNGTTMASTIIASGEQAQSNRSLRNYGYKVYRSEDNRQSWTDLTVSGPIYPDTLAATPATATSFVTNNNTQTPVYDRLVSFVDYTVSSLASSTTDVQVDRARVYWYKVVPYYLKKEQTYYTTSNNDHHMIKVTLPPKNMALVHRMIANRTVCLEMQKSINKKAGAHYSCTYNGLGASGLAYPWLKGNTVYDVGGDLLVDRFELGCAFTRGAADGTSYDASVTSAATLKNANMDSFKGCLNYLATSYEPFKNSLVSASSTGTYRPHQIVAGDCFGKDGNMLAYYGTNPNLCTADATYFSKYSFPGSRAVQVPCEDVKKGDEFQNFVHFPTADLFTDLGGTIYPTQSEFGAVYYNRLGHLDNWDYQRGLVYKGALTLQERADGLHTKTLAIGNSGSEAGVVRRSSCTMNLGYKDGSNYIPRWIPVSALMGELKARTVNDDPTYTRNSAVSLQLYNKKMPEVRANEHLYNDEMAAPPSRFRDDMPLARLFSSNGSKLPPLDGMSQNDLALICGTYKVEVGIQKGSGSFVPLSEPKSKRLIRKKESTVAAAWPAHLPATGATSITSMETGQCNGSGRNQTGIATNNNASLILPLFPNSGRTGALVITGSSSLDGAGHTEKCVSKFGIQDMAGNILETNSEEIFCDYRPESSAKLFIGDYRGGVPAAGIDKVKSVPYRGDGMHYDSSIDAFGNLTGNGVRVMLEENVDNRSGACSIINKRVEDGIYLAGNNIIPIIKSDGTLNTTMIQTLKTQDQESVNTLRNGDGSFLTFGKDKVVMALDKNNKIGTFSMFNPAVGLPILCGSSANCEANTDNQFVKGNVVLGNSSFSNTGVSEFGSSTIAGGTPPGTPTLDLQEYYINQWLINQIISTTGMIPDPADPAIEFPITNVPPSGGGYVTPTRLSYAYWSISRDLDTGETGSTLRMYTGGSGATAAGRYSVKIDGLNAPQERFPSTQRGGRCVVLINNE